MPEPLVLVKAIVPAVLAVVNIVMERRMDARDAANKRGKLPRPAILELTVVSDEPRPSLGSSVSEATSISGTPTLDSEELAFVDASGKRYHVDAGTKVRVVSFAGAERPLLRTVTTASGIEQRYGFHVSTTETVWMVAESTPVGESAPFRGEASTPLKPWGPTISIASDRKVLDDATSGAEKSFLFAAWFGLPLAVVTAVAGLEIFPGWVFWTGLALGVVWFLVTLIPS